MSLTINLRWLTSTCAHTASAVLAPILLFTAAFTSNSAHAGDADTAEDINSLSIAELANIEISSVSKKAEPLNAAPASIYVITNDDVNATGARSVPEMLRLAPNLQVAQIGSDAYALSARGFNGTLANKLLVLIDGRTVYTPLQGGVYWDMQDIVREDLDHIEVISGPGATLWGTNAVNGVINITTRSSADTQGGILDLGVGNAERSATIRYGGRLSDDLTYRVYAKGFRRDSAETATGASAHDNWSVPAGGFRMDWHPGADLFTLQGDMYQGYEDQPAKSDQDVSGRNILGRWTHQMNGGSQLQVQAYYDRVKRFDGAGFVQETYDIDVQHSISIGSWNDVVWGGGYRVIQYDITNVAAFQILPANKQLQLGNGFVQDSLRLTKAVKLTLGLKLEDDPYSGLAPLPSARLSWHVNDQFMLWSAVSRAVRSPTLYETGVALKLGPTLFLAGNPSFKAEKLLAYEVGTRFQPSSRFSVSISSYYHDYDDLRSTERASSTTLLPLHYGNLMSGHVYGVEAWANVKLADWWLVAAGLHLQHENLRFEPGSSGLGGLQQAGNDPEYQASLRSSIALGSRVSWEADLRYEGALPNPAVPAYVELNSELSVAATDYLQLVLSGTNLLHRRHLEFAPSLPGVQIPRSFFLETRWKF